MAFPNPVTGAVGGWWFFSPANTINDVTYFMKVDIQNTSFYDFIASFDVVLNSVTTTGVVTAVDYNITLRYQSGTGPITLTINNPIPDSMIGHTGTEARNVWAIPWRFALVFQCSTYDSTSGLYAADGFVKLFLNGNSTPLLSAINVRIPRRYNTSTVFKYSVGLQLDCDRLWARSQPIVLPTNPDGSILGASPSDLVFFEDFNSGDFSAWTTQTFNPVFPPTPLAWPDCGGGGGYGISTYCCGPSTNICASGVVNSPTAGLFRTMDAYPPPPPPDLSGIYYIKPGNTHDSYYNAVEKKIPDPTMKTGVLGE